MSRNLPLGWTFAFISISCGANFTGTAKKPGDPTTQRTEACASTQTSTGSSNCAAVPVTPVPVATADVNRNDIVPVSSVPGLSREAAECLGSAGIVKASKKVLMNAVKKIGASSFAPFASNEVEDNPEHYADDADNPEGAITFVTIGNIGPFGNSMIKLMNKNSIYCFVSQTSMTVFNNTQIIMCKGAKLSFGGATGMGGAMGQTSTSVLGDNPAMGTQTKNVQIVKC